MCLGENCLAYYELGVETLPQDNVVGKVDTLGKNATLKKIFVYTSHQDIEWKSQIGAKTPGFEQKLKG